MQPGTTITPGKEGEQQQPAPQPTVAQPTPTADAPVSQPAPQAVATPSEPQSPTPSESSTQAPSPEPATGWQYSGGNPSNDHPDHPQASSKESITWSASEYIDHEKNRSWFLGIAGTAVLVAAIVYLVTRDVISSVCVLFAGGLLAVSGARKPRTLKYSIDSHGIQIGTKLYPYARFKSFAIMEEGAFDSIQLMPTQRFAPAVSLYYPPEQEEAIATTLGDFLPHEERRHDPIDSLMRRIKF